MKIKKGRFRSDPDMMQAPDSHFYAAADGLRLHYDDYWPHAAPDLLPVVCLPGLTRSARDFAALARALSTSPNAPRRVLAFDYRGRGLSEHDADWRRYDLLTERNDLLAGLVDAGVAAAHFVGTSRGGLHLLALAEQHRAILRGIVLNDIGPVLEPDGLRRIRSYVGKPAAPRDRDEAVALLKRGAGFGFDGLSDEEWSYFARTTFGDDSDDLGLRYDPDLARTLESFDLTKPLPQLWAQFDALEGLPLLAIRGQGSDLLSPSTFGAMVERWPACRGYVVPGQGHAPLLADPPTIARIHDFLREADAAVASGTAAS